MSSRWENPARIATLVADMSALATAIAVGAYEPVGRQAHDLTVAAAELVGKSAGYMPTPMDDE